MKHSFLLLLLMSCASAQPPQVSTQASQDNDNDAFIKRAKHIRCTKFYQISKKCMASLEESEKEFVLGCVENEDNRYVINTCTDLTDCEKFNECLNEKVRNTQIDSIGSKNCRIISVNGKNDQLEKYYYIHTTKYCKNKEKNNIILWASVDKKNK